MPLPYVFVIARRTAAAWLQLHLVIWGGALLMQLPPPLRFAPTVLPLALSLIVGIVLLQGEIRRDRLFLANLGVGRRRIAGLALVAALGLESLVWTVT